VALVVADLDARDGDHAAHARVVEPAGQDGLHGAVERRGELLLAVAHARGSSSSGRRSRSSQRGSPSSVEASPGSWSPLKTSRWHAPSCAPGVRPSFATMRSKREWMYAPELETAARPMTARLSESSAATSATATWCSRCSLSFPERTTRLLSFRLWLWLMTSSNCSTPTNMVVGSRQIRACA